MKSNFFSVLQELLGDIENYQYRIEYGDDKEESKKLLSEDIQNTLQHYNISKREFMIELKDRSGVGFDNFISSLIIR